MSISLSPHTYPQKANSFLCLPNFVIYLKGFPFPLSVFLLFFLLCFVSFEIFFLFILSNVWVRRKRWHPTLVLLPGKSHGQRSLVGCSPWDREESGTTERLYFHFLLSCIGERNGNPLQCSCLENPRDRGAWWTAIYGVAHSWTRLKRLSSSNGWVFFFFVVFVAATDAIIPFPSSFHCFSFMLCFEEISFSVWGVLVLFFFFFSDFPCVFFILLFCVLWGFGVFGVFLPFLFGFSFPFPFPGFLFLSAFSVLLTCFSIFLYFSFPFFFLSLGFIMFSFFFWGFFEVLFRFF